ncbi:MAG: thioredoxin family protein [Vampirovibrionales bacterium]
MFDNRPKQFNQTTPNHKALDVKGPFLPYDGTTLDSLCCAGPAACAASLAWMPWITGCNNDALHSTPNTPQDAASGLYLVPKGLTPEAVSGLFSDSVGQGKPLVVDFTSRFCYECRQLKPKLEALAKTYPDITFQLVSIQSKDAHDQALLNAFHVTTVPYVAFIDGSGQVKKVVIDNTSPD